jgi:hypothetical protein
MSNKRYFEMFKKITVFALIGMAAMIGQGIAGVGSSSEKEPGKELTPTEKENARKLMMLQQGAKQQGAPLPKDVVRGDIGPTLHALTKPFTCPTAQELKTGINEKGIFQKDGVYFYTIFGPTIINHIKNGPDLKFESADIFLDQNSTIVEMFCVYTTSSLERSIDFKLDFKKSGFDKTALSVKPGVMTKIDANHHYSKDIKTEFMIDQPKK